MQVPGATAVITGGASGLGEATALRLHAGGANVVMVDLDEARGQALAGKLGERAAFVRTDVTVSEQVQAAIDRAVERFGRIDIAVNCAGIAGAQRTITREGPANFDYFKRIVEVSLFGTFDVIRLAAFKMSQNEPNEDDERGVIVNTASAAAFEGQIGQAAYSAAKGGIVAMTLPIARDLAGVGIRVCTIAPGNFDTPMFGQMPEQMKLALISHAPFPRRAASQMSSRGWSSRSSRTRCSMAQRSAWMRQPECRRSNLRLESITAWVN